MSVLHIKESVERVINHYKENPDDARGPGAPVTAIMEDGPGAESRRKMGQQP